MVVSGDIRFCGVLWDFNGFHGGLMEFHGCFMGCHGSVMGVLWVFYRISWGCHGILWDILDILYPLAITNSLRTGSHGPFSSMIKMMIYLWW